MASQKIVQHKWILSSPNKYVKGAFAHPIYFTSLSNPHRFHNLFHKENFYPKTFQINTFNDLFNETKKKNLSLEIIMIWATCFFKLSCLLKKEFFQLSFFFKTKDKEKKCTIDLSFHSPFSSFFSFLPSNFLHLI